MKNREGKEEGSPHLRLFFIISVSLISLIALLWFILVRLDFNAYKDKNTELVDSLVEDLSEKILGKLDHYANLLHIAAQSVSSILEEHSDQSDDIESLFFNLLVANPQFFQIRYIDHLGEEKYRLNQKDGAITIVEESELQNKSNRYYFQEAVAQGKESLYISPLDLNIENGKIDVPWIPTLRMATGIPDPSGEGLGVVIFNIDMSDVLAIFQENENKSKRLLINSDGYYLAGVEPERLWGFMFENQTGLVSDNPELWNHIQQEGNGHREISDYLYTFASVNTSNLFNHSSGLFEAYTSRIWTIVLDNDQHFSLLAPGIHNLIIASVLIAVIITISRSWSKSIVEKRSALESKRIAEAALIKSENMAALGRIVASVAHELNTPIGTSVTLASTIDDHLRKFSLSLSTGQIQKSVLDNFIKTTKNATSMMLSGLRQAATLIALFKQVSVDQTSQRRRAFRIPEYIEDIVGTLRPSFKNRSITIDVVSNQTIVLDSYPGPFAQIITNLVSNAVVHAFPGDSGGKIVIQVSSKPNKVLLSVKDNGDGIAEDDMSKIFNPFFTTSSDIGGSGLGLHIVHNLVCDLFQGTIEVQSEKGSFTEFILELPISGEELKGV